MTLRTFDPTQIVYGGKSASGFKITCGKCSAVAKSHCNTFTGNARDQERLMSQWLEKRFAEMGWKVGDRSRDDRCPQCVAIAAPPPKVPPSGVLKGLESVGAAKAVMQPSPSDEAPREMDVDDRRLIFSAIDEVYLGKDKGYSDDWTDDKIAVKHGYPRAWVTEVREKFFGPTGRNEALNRQIDAANAEVARIMEQATHIARCAEDLKTHHGILIQTADRLRAEIQKAIAR